MVLDEVKHKGGKKADPVLLTDDEIPAEVQPGRDDDGLHQ